MRTRLFLLALTLLGLVLVGCPSSPVTPGTDAAVADGGGTMEDSGPVDGGGGACAPTDVPCIDQSISMLDLFDTVSPDSITEMGTTAGEFLTHVDAQGGGFMPNQSFVYARFTDAGLTKVEVSDEDAFTSTDWDIAFRRYIVRLNSGVSGPSCVTAARTAPATTFEDVTTPPAGLSYRTEIYLGDTCELMPDGSGLPGSPATALSSYWSYPGCVSMTHNVYVIALASGRHVKFEVESYYAEPNQTSCDGPDHTITTPSGAGNFMVRWAFLD
jgi:hypothetical protein